MTTNRRSGRIGKKDPKSVPEIAQRLRLLRQALASSQAEFCRRMSDFPVKTWNNYEVVAGRISIDAAIVLVRTFGVTLDWIYLGDAAMMPHHLMQKIAEVAAAEERKYESVTA
jgi:hypothetical protein